MADQSVVLVPPQTVSGFVIQKMKTEKMPKNDKVVFHES